MSPNLEVVLAVLADEAKGDVAAALAKLAPGYRMTWMYKGREELFPQTTNDVSAELEEAYVITGRSYEIKHWAEGPGVVMVELIERYPDPETGFLYQTPLVLVLEMEDGKIRNGRHYCDPALSYKTLTEADFERAYAGTTTKQIITGS